MPEAHELIKDLALVLGVAAVTTVVFQKLRQPVVLGYLLAGLIVGPHVPIPLVADKGVVHALSELGVILLMFSLGLEFRLRKLFAVGPAVALVVLVEVSFVMWLGFVAGRLLGWPATSSLFVGAVVAISSTTIIAKAFDGGAVEPRLRELVFGVLVFEDLIAILLLTALTAVSSGHQLSTGVLAMTVGKLAAFLMGTLVVGMLLVPRTVRMIVRLGRPETIVIGSVGLCFVIALLARAFGYPVALGAFLAGALVAESGEERRITPLVAPVRDIFGAVFFVAVGMSIDPALVVGNAGSVVTLTLVVILGKVVGVALGAFLGGHGARRAVQAGMSLAQIGEFSFILAALAPSDDGKPLYPIAVAVSAITTMATPWMIRASSRVASVVDDALPRPLQTFASLYGSWVERLRDGRTQRTMGGMLRRLLGFLLLDAALLAAAVVGASVALEPAAEQLEQRLDLGEGTARALVVAGSAALATPFFIGLVQLARRLGRFIAAAALPAAGGGPDLANAPRRALVVAVELGCVVMVGAPLVAVTQPFLPSFYGFAVLLALLAGLAFSLWRSASNLEGHVRAGAHMIVEALATQARRNTGVHSLEAVDKLLPGLGTPLPLMLEDDSPAVGKTLAELDLRGITGATVLAITRGEQGLVVPSADERMRAGDILALAGSHEAIRAATALLRGLTEPPTPKIEPLPRRRAGDV